jgi:hypothetical protein
VKDAIANNKQNRRLTTTTTTNIAAPTHLLTTNSTQHNHGDSLTLPQTLHHITPAAPSFEHFSLSFPLMLSLDNTHNAPPPDLGERRVLVETAVRALHFE